MNPAKLKKLVFTGVTGLLICTPLYAGKPVWTYSAPNPSSVAVANGGSATIQYIVTNQSAKTKNLVMNAIHGISSSPCHLQTRSSTCVLTLTINGNLIPSGGIHTGPVLCESGNPNQCYQPTAANQLRISNATILSAVGYYRSGSRDIPLSYTSNNYGLRWTASIIMPPPEGSGINQLRSVSCDDSGHCATVGRYANSGQTSPLSYTSSDYGVTWVVSNILPPPQSTNDNLSSVFCAKSGHCVSAGTYGANAFSQPLSYISNNYGIDWTESIIMPPALGTSYNRIDSITCNSSDHCVLVGYYNDNGVNTPSSYISNNFGATWVTSSIMPPQIPDSTDSRLHGVSCTASGHCSIVGRYQKSNGKYFPLSYISNDYGITWTISAVMPPAEGVDDNRLSSVACGTSAHCTTVGYYRLGSQDVPLSYVSNDYGNTWILSAAPPKAQGSGHNQLNSVTCDDFGHCVAVGQYNSNGQSIPLSYVSNDYGMAWDLSTTQPEAQGSGNHQLIGISGGNGIDD